MTVEPDLQGRVLLLVEDDPDMAVLQQRMLQKNGYRVIHASSGEEAVRLAAEHPELDLILMDIDLGPGMLGTDAAQAILESRDVPITFLSSHTDRATVEKTQGITSYGYILKTSGEAVILASIRMSFRLFESRMNEKEKARVVQENEQRFRSIFDQAGAGVALVDVTSGKIFRANIAFCILLAMSESELQNRRYEEFHAEQDHSDANRKELLLSGEAADQTSERKLNTLEGERWVRETITATWPEQSNAYFIVIWQDITEQHRAQAELLDSERRYRRLFEGNPMPMWVFDRETLQFMAVNDAAIDHYGYSRDEFLAMDISQIRPDGDKERLLGILTAEENRSDLINRSGVWRHKRKDGSVIWVEVTGHKLEFRGRPAKMILALDITERLEAQKELERNLSEKDFLLQESSRRIRRNITALETVLRFKIQSVPEDSARIPLAETLQRLAGIRALYNCLLLSHVQEHENAGSYLKELSDLVVSANLHRARIQLVQRLSPIAMEPSRLLTLGVITNELISNAIQHAFINQTEGTINVELLEQSGKVILIVKDDGRGIPENPGGGMGAGTGLSMVRMLAQNLNGSCEFKGERRNRVELEFPLHSHSLVPGIMDVVRSNRTSARATAR